MEMMKAVRYHGYGGPEVLRLEDVPRPTSAAGEILVRVHAAGVNPVDWKVREGYLKDYLRHTLPVIPGWDFSGVVEAAAPDVKRFKKGDEVFARPDIARNGAYAEYLVVRASEVAFKPKSIDHIQAASIPLAALTAWQAMFDVGGVRAGGRVLIHAAAGGVGCAAVQLAKWRGAYVIGTASRRNLAFVRELGADETVDYETTRFEEVVRDVDMVLDSMGGDTQERSWGVLKKGGILVCIVAIPSAEAAAKHGVKGVHHFVQPDSAQLAEIAGLVDGGKFRPIVETVLPLAEARHAQEISKEHHVRGKIVLRMAGP